MALRLVDQIAVRYVAFGLVSIAANVGTQDVILRLMPNVAVFTSVVGGTAIGFVLKYWLDKKWIFFFKSHSKAHEARTVTLYAVFSVFTTLLFWATEMGFWWLWRQPEAKYTGALLGLFVGFVIKYQLDRRFVF